MLNLGGLDLQQQFALNYNITKIYLQEIKQMDRCVKKVKKMLKQFLGGVLDMRVGTVKYFQLCCIFFQNKYQKEKKWKYNPLRMIQDN